MYHHPSPPPHHSPSSHSLIGGLRRLPSYSSTAAVVPLSVSGSISAFAPPHDEYPPLHPRPSPPYHPPRQHSIGAGSQESGGGTMLMKRMAHAKYQQNGNGAGDPWAGAFTKSFMPPESGLVGAGRKVSDAPRPFSLASKLAAEFVGTLLFVFIGVLSAVHSAQQQQNGGADGMLHAALAHGLAIFVLASALGHVSGGHFNPAVSLGIALSGHMHPALVLFYAPVQLAGGLGAALLAMIVTSHDQFQSIAGGATVVPADSATHFWYQALVVEAVLTGLLVLTVLCCAIDQQSPLGPLAIGVSICAAVLGGGGALSGAVLNPARAFGPCLAASLFLGENSPVGTKLADPMWSLHFVYWAGPFVGAAGAALLYRTFFVRSASRLLP